MDNAQTRQTHQDLVMPDSSDDAGSQIKRLIRIAEALCEVFAQENRLIGDRRADEIAPLQPEKERLAAEYSKSIRDLSGNRGVMEQADPEQLAQLRAAAATLEERALQQQGLMEQPVQQAAAS